MSRIAAGVLLGFVVAAPTLAEGFGWHGRSFRYEAIGQVFGGGRAAPKTIELLQRQMHECVMSIYGDEVAADDAASVLGDMLRDGWKLKAGKKRSSDYFFTFGSVADCPALLPEFAFGPQAEMVAPIAFESALERLADPDLSVMRHFVKFGRAFGADESFERCREAQPGYAVQFEAPLTWCSPIYLILTPDEVKRLKVEIDTALPGEDPDFRYSFEEFGRFVSAAAKENRAIFFEGFD